MTACAKNIPTSAIATAFLFAASLSLGLAQSASADVTPLTLEEWPSARDAQAACLKIDPALMRERPPLAPRRLPTPQRMALQLAAADLDEVGRELDAFASCLAALELLAARVEASPQRDAMMFLFGDDRNEAIGLLSLHLRFAERFEAYLEAPGGFERARGGVSGALSLGLFIPEEAEAFDRALWAYAQRTYRLTAARSRLGETRGPIDAIIDDVTVGARPSRNPWEAMRSLRDGLHAVLSAARPLLVAPELLTRAR